MQTHHADTPEEVNMMKLLSKLQTLEAQKSLLSETVKSRELLESKIISSLHPTVGKTFTHTETEMRKQKILNDTRKKLICLAIEDKEIELTRINTEFNLKKVQYTENNADPTSFLLRLEKLIGTHTYRLNKTMNKKVSFHLGRQTTPTKFVKKKVQVQRKRKWTANRKKKNRIAYRTKTKMKKQQRIQAIVSKIKQGNTVINLSDEVVPDSVFMFLAKGLGYVPAKRVDFQDLKYDMTEFIRKLSWKAFFKANPDLANTDPFNDIHRDIKVSGFTYPSFSSPLLDEVKTKLFGWIANHTPLKPKPNLSPLEFRGRKWLMDKIKDQTLFVTKADKGGATLIMNFADVKAAIENELFDTTKFVKLNRNTEQQLDHVKNEVKSLTIELAQRKLISESDKTLIAGLTSNNRPKIAPEYHPEHPYAYPLFKIHKLSNTQLENKVIPPNRLVHASKFGPLYRMEKWSSPYLTDISREFCKE